MSSHGSKRLICEEQELARSRELAERSPADLPHALACPLDCDFARRIGDVREGVTHGEKFAKIILANDAPVSRKIPRGRILHDGMKMDRVSLARFPLAHV